VVLAALRAATNPRTLPGVTIRWFTDADRQAMREEKETAQEERRVLDELDRKYAREDRSEPLTPERLRVINYLQIDPNRRR
jgi:hypothetical protein